MSRRRYRGTVGVAAAAFLLKKTIWVKPNKIHKVIRDVKLAESHCCNKVVERAELWSSYLFGFNKTPFGSSTNSSLKNSIVVHLPGFGNSGRSFLLVNTKGKYMPYESRHEQLAIFYEVPKPRSLNHKLGRAAERVEMVCVERHGRYTCPRV